MIGFGEFRLRKGFQTLRMEPDEIKIPKTNSLEENIDIVRDKMNNSFSEDVGTEFKDNSCFPKTGFPSNPTSQNSDLSSFISENSNDVSPPLL